MHFISTFILQYFFKMFFFFSLLELNNYNGYARNFIIVVSYDELIINKVL